MIKRISAVAGPVMLAFTLSSTALADDLSSAVEKDYKQHLEALFDYFHLNPELSSM